jgi:hypothetical protein
MVVISKLRRKRPQETCEGNLGPYVVLADDRWLPALRGQSPTVQRARCDDPRLPGALCYEPFANVSAVVVSNS